MENFIPKQEAVYLCNNVQDFDGGVDSENEYGEQRNKHKVT